MKITKTNCLSFKRRDYRILNTIKGILHWSKELRIKNTTEKGLPVKVALFI